MDSERHVVYFMGKPVGTCSGWDEADDLAMQVYDFEPSGIRQYNLTKTDCMVFSPFSSPSSKYYVGLIYSLTEDGQTGTVFLK